MQKYPPRPDGRKVTQYFVYMIFQKTDNAAQITLDISR